MKKFLLVDDHIIIRSGIKGLLAEIYKTAEIDETENGDDVVKQLKEKQYDLIIMDIQMPNTDTLGLVEYIHIKFPDTKILMFSMGAENIYARRFLNAGAKGFLSKGASVEEIIKAVNLVLSDRKYISQTLADILLESSLANKPSNPFDALTNREFEVATLLLSGQGVSDISKSLNVQVSTVGTHKARLFEKLEISNILQLKELATSYNL